MKSTYPQSTSAIFGLSTASTPSASSTVDSMSPHVRDQHLHSVPPPNSHYGMVPHPQHTPYLSTYQNERRDSDIPNFFSPGADSGDASQGYRANAYLPSPYLDHFHPRSSQPSSSRQRQDDSQIPFAPRQQSPAAQSPNFSFEIPLPSRSMPQYGRAAWQDPANNWSRSSGEGASIGTRNVSSIQDAGDEGRSQGMRPSSESSPLSAHMAAPRTYSGPPTIASPIGEYDYPKSAAYPGNLYSDLVGDLATWGPGREATGADCGQALAIYEHLFSSLPHLRPVPAGSNSDFPAGLQPLLDLSAEGLAFFSIRQDQAQPQQHELPHPTVDLNEHVPSPATDVPAPRRTGKDRAHTKCLGCGATETPEWRRGPLGPRTLCNACGLVYMKLQRKRKKQDEKTAAAKAELEGASAAAAVSIAPTPPKKAKRNEEG